MPQIQTKLKTSTREMAISCRYTNVPTNVNLLDLPEDFWKTITSEWLQLKDICNLDSSIVNAHYRPYLLHILRISVIQESFLPSLKSKCISWLSLRSITLLKLNVDIQVKDSMIPDLRAVCCSTKCLDIGGSSFNDSSLNELLTEGKTNLKSLNISSCSAITCEGLKKFTQGFSGMESLSARRWYLTHENILKSLFQDGIQFQFLKMVNFSGNYDCVTDEGLKYLARRCSRLEELHIVECRRITNTGIVKVAEGCPELQVLDICRCKNVTDEGLKVVIELCKLTIVNVEGLKGITDKSLECLAIHSPNLRNLNIGACSISNAGLKALSLGCKHLKRLLLSETNSITDVGLKYLHEGCTELDAIDLGNDNTVTARGRSLFKSCFGF